MNRFALYLVLMVEDFASGFKELWTTTGGIFIVYLLAILVENIVHAFGNTAALGVNVHVIGLTAGAVYILALGIWAALPSQKDALIIFGLPELVKNQMSAIQEAGELPTKMLKLVNKYLGEQLTPEGHDENS